MHFPHWNLNKVSFFRSLFLIRTYLNLPSWKTEEAKGGCSQMGHPNQLTVQLFVVGCGQLLRYQHSTKYYL